MKDVERAAARRGVVSQTVKDVVQSLVDDDLVHVDKIGTSNWYWAFPGEATNNARSALANAEATKEALEGEKNALTKEVNKEKKKNPVTDKHERTSAALASAKESNAALKDELETFSSSNPETVEATRAGAEISKRAANVWTDNVFMMKSWAENKMGDKDQVSQFFKTEGVNLNTFDYVE